MVSLPDFADTLNQTGGSYLTESVYNVVLQKSIPAQIRQLFLYISNDRGLVDEFVRDFCFAKRL